MNTEPQNEKSFDAVVVGAGLAGLYMLYRLRNRGLDVQVIERAPGVGGTWYWNAYPGARCDVESMDYSYSFSPELEQEWTWTEKYAGQPEILEYVNYVANKFNLRPHIQFNTTVKDALYDKASARWTVVTDTGERFLAKYCIFATGSLSEPIDPPFKGVRSFRGEWFQTQKYPHKPVDYKGKRVAVIGTGSSGVQAIPVIAEDASELFVFQRTPNFSVPARNRPLREDEILERKATYRDHRRAQRESPSGVQLDVNPKSALDMTSEEQQSEMERRWSYGGAPVFNVSFADVMVNKKSNDVVADFVRDKIREKVHDPELAEQLIPTDHPIAAKRLICDHGYFETYNKEHVHLINVKQAPIQEITPGGILLEDGREFEVDIILYALGYDALSGTLLQMNIEGKDGLKLRDEWKDGPKTYLGLSVAGFPNMFTITGPGSPAVLAVMIVAIEQHVEWIDACIGYMEDRGLSAIEASSKDQDLWTEKVAEIAAGTVFPLAKNSYYLGANVPGKPSTFPLYAAGQKSYRDICEEVAKNGYRGFIFQEETSELPVGVK